MNQTTSRSLKKLKVNALHGVRLLFAYVCPAKRNLALHTNKLAKQKLRAATAKK